MPESAKALFAAAAHRPLPERSHAAARSRKEPEAPDGAGLKSACQEMEALFLHHLLNEMRKTIPKSGFIDGGRAEEIYTSLMDAELARQMAQTGGTGLAELLLEQIHAGSSGANGPSRRHR